MSKLFSKSIYAETAGFGTGMGPDYKEQEIRNSFRDRQH